MLRLQARGSQAASREEEAGRTLPWDFREAVLCGQLEFGFQASITGEE